METIKQIEIPIRMAFYKLTGVSFEPYTWDKLIGIVEFIENIDDSKNHYTWQSQDEKGVMYEHNNFQGYTVNIEGNSCWICLDLALDPGITISNEIGSSKFDAVLKACYKFALKYNNNEI